MTDPFDTRPHSRAAQWWVPLVHGFLAGIVFAWAEILLLPGIGRVTTIREDLWWAALLQAFIGVLMGAVVLLGALLITRRPPSGALSAAIVWPVFGVWITAVYVHIHLLPSFRSPVSAAATAALALGFSAIGVVIQRRLARREVRRWLIRPGARECIAGLCLLGISAGIFYVPRGANRAGGPDLPLGTNFNVLLVVVDALRADHLTVYGYERETSPNIARWSREAALFERAMSHAPWTKPSVASILTGLYPSTHGAVLVESRLPKGVPSLPEILRAAGLRTALFSGNTFISSQFGFDRGVDHLQAPTRPRFAATAPGHTLRWAAIRHRPVRTLALGLLKLERKLLREEMPVENLEAEGLTRAFLAWLDESPDRPFFAYIHYMDAHQPYGPPPLYARAFRPSALAGMDDVARAPVILNTVPFDEVPPMSGDSLANMVALYDGSVRYVDECFEQILKALRSRGLYDRTLILLTADHGVEFHEHGRWGHQHSIYQEVLHVPLMMSGPGVEGLKSRRVPNVVRHVDLLPTVLDVLGMAPLPKIEGRSLLPVLRGSEPPTPARPVLMENHFPRAGEFARAIVDGGHKLIHARRGPERRILMYDLDEDPAETRNLFDPESERGAELLDRLERLHASAVGKAVRRASVRIDPETRQRLRALGYIQ